MRQPGGPVSILDHRIQNHDPRVIVEVYRAFIADDGQIVLGRNLFELRKQAPGLLGAGFEHGDADPRALNKDPVLQATAYLALRIVEHVKLLHMRSSSPSPASSTAIALSGESQPSERRRARLAVV